MAGGREESVGVAIIRQANIERVARDASELHLGDLQAEARRVESAAAARAKALEEQGKAERAKIVAGSREEGLRLGREEGLALGRREGFEEGRKAALQEHREALAGVERGLGEALEAFVRLREGLLLEARQDLVGLSLAIASRVVKRVVEGDPEVVAGQVASAVATAARGSRLVIRLHPADLEIVRRVMPRVAALAGDNVELAEEGGMARGGARVSSSRGGEIDASIETQLDRIAAALLPLGSGGGAEAVDGGGEA